MERSSDNDNMGIPGEIAQFQITDFSRFGSVWFGMVKVLSFVWPRSRLLRI